MGRRGAPAARGQRRLAGARGAVEDDDPAAAGHGVMMPRSRALPSADHEPAARAPRDPRPARQRAPAGRRDRERDRRRRVRGRHRARPDAAAERRSRRRRRAGGETTAGSRPPSAQILAEIGEDPDPRGPRRHAGPRPPDVPRADRRLPRRPRAADQQGGLRGRLQRDGRRQGHPVLLAVRAPPAAVLRRGRTSRTSRRAG